MRIDVVSIFPEYLAPLGLSLVGKARHKGLLDLRVHDLRDWTHDPHRTVDDTPYGGGAGMVMKPEPWGEALDAVLADQEDRGEGGEGSTRGPVLVVPTPSGERLTQRLATELAREERVVIACGRYEGIDQRVMEHFAGRVRVRELSLGDYVLNGGEVAAMVVVEAVVRLLPGFMGNDASLTEESHTEAGLLEYPVYTKPSTWRGLDVPEVLRSGDHARIAAWRRDQAVRRTAERRPDLLHPSAATEPEGMEVARATRSDLGEILTLQWACFEPDLHESLEELTEDVLGSTTFVLRAAGRLVATVRCRLLEDGQVWEVGLLMVAPDLRRRGTGRWLLEYAEQAAPPGVRTFRLFTGSAKDAQLRFYRRLGYSVRGEREDHPGVVVLTKRR